MGPCPIAHTGSVEIHLSPTVAGLLNSPPRVSLPADQPVSLLQVLLSLEKTAPGALLEPSTGWPRRHIMLFVNRRPVMELEHRLRGGDVLQVDLRMIEGG